MNLILRNIQYHPSSTAVALWIEPPAPPPGQDSPIKPFFVTTTQDALQALAAPNVPWSDAEALSAAQTGVDALYQAWAFTVVLPSPPE